MREGESKQGSERGREGRREEETIASAGDDFYDGWIELVLYISGGRGVWGLCLGPYCVTIQVFWVITKSSSLNECRLLLLSMNYHSI